MATIQQDLAAIRAAVYGKDVREAIADGIEKCYEDSTAGAQIALIEQKGQETLDSIPDDYTALSDNLENLKSAITDGFDSLRVTDDIVLSSAGVVAEKYSETTIKVYGAPTGTRRICGFNGNGSVKSTTSEFEKTLDAGVYVFTGSATGYQTDFAISATYTTFESPFIVVNNATPSVTITFDSPVMLCFTATVNKNYGTSANPTYVSVSAKKLSAIDNNARDQIEKLKSAFGMYSQSAAAAIGTVPIAFNEFGYYRTPEDGSPVSFVGSPKWISSKFSVASGDVIFMNVTAGAGVTRAYTYIDENGNAIGRSAINLNGFILSRVPNDAVYMAINNYIVSQPDGFWALKGEPIKDTVKGIIDAIGSEKEITNIWVSGGINSSTGALSTSTTRIRFYSYIYAGLKMKISAPDGMKFYIYRYADANIESYKHCEGWYTGEKTICYPNEYIKLVAAYSDDAEISPSAGNNIIRTLYTVTDESLTMQGKSADAKVVGDKLAVLKSITETIDVPESIASITGNDGDTYTASGITMTKISDHEFTLTGNYTQKVPKCFNVLLGSNQIEISSSAVLATNITTPGTYTVSYTAVNSSDRNYTEPVFAVTDGTVRLRKYLKSGEPFIVGLDPVSLFVYAPVKLRLNSETVTVKWALYYGEEGIGIPYSESQTASTAIDARARNYAFQGGNGKTQATSEYMSWGKANTMANARQIMDIKWTPVADTMPMGRSTYFTKDVEYTGVPYSSVRDNSKAIGTNVSIRTFMTAVHDPNSVLYTRISTTSNASTYYGTVCSGLCNHAYGIGLNLTNYYLGTSDWFETIPMQDVQSGDMIYRHGHVGMIFDVIKDEYGRIETIAVMEEWFPDARYVLYSSYEKFLERRVGYVARRFKAMNGVQYVQSPFVRCFDEDEEDVIYPDVQTDHGDAAVFGYCAGAGSNFVDYANVSGIKINVINPRDFTNITVTREGASSPVYSTNSIQSFTIPASSIAPGLYTVTATGTQNESESTFFVADVNGSYDLESGVITFSSSNATPVLAEIYNLPMEDGLYALVNQDIPLTDADRDAGMINAFDRVQRGFAYAKVTFDTPYGQAIWRSEAHPTWEPIG